MNKNYENKLPLERTKMKEDIIITCMDFIHQKHGLNT